MHEHTFGNSLVKLGNLEKNNGFLQGWISKILESGVICMGKVSDFEKLFRNSFTFLVDIFTPVYDAQMLRAVTHRHVRSFLSLQQNLLLLH